MPTLKKRVNFFVSDEGVEVKSRLRMMVKDVLYNTDSSYSTDSDQYPDNLIPFVDKHMNYLNSHPSVDLTQYLSNLRIMTRNR